MAGRPEITETSVPRLPRGVRLRFDEARQQWVILAPERVLMPDEMAVTILQRCLDGASVGTVIDQLVTEYDAPRAEIAADVLAMLQDLADKAMLEP
jgi:pyrroloquinoline quinone biosynthesis protein D